MKQKTAILISISVFIFLVSVSLSGQDTIVNKTSTDVLQFYVRLRTLDNKKVIKGAFHKFINDSIFLTAVDKKYNVLAGIVRTMNEDSIVGFDAGEIKQINIMRNGLVVKPENRKEKIVEYAVMSFITDGWWGIFSLRQSPKNEFRFSDSNYKTSPDFWKVLGAVGPERIHPRRGDLYIISGDTGKFREMTLILTGIIKKPYEQEE
jgi:hypothetical protein